VDLNERSVKEKRRDYIQTRVKPKLGSRNRKKRDKKVEGNWQSHIKS
jgi:hypothetical protein